MSFGQCSCRNTDLRRKTGSDGRARFAAQCLDCGRMVGNWLKHSEIVDPQSAPEWDEELRDAHFRRQMESINQARATQRSEWFAQHSIYLRSDRWSRTRQKVLERAEGLCEGCRDRAAAHVHHLSYAHWQRELLYELVALCEPCHDKAHEVQR